MGEKAADRVAMLVTLANLPQPPESVPINMLIAIPGTPLADAEPIDSVWSSCAPSRSPAS